MKLLALFVIGAILMRGAGCTFNDIVDRKLDAQVERTRLRPIASGQVTLAGAAVFLAAQLLGALIDPGAIQHVCRCSSERPRFFWSRIYPFMKRITYWPQLFLGLAFNWGALLGWAAVDRRRRDGRRPALRGRHLLDAGLRHHLCTSGQGGRHPDRRKINSFEIW